MRKLLIRFALTLLVGAAVRDGTWGRWFARDLSIYVFDIGQGDAIFIDGPERQILIDGGPDGRVVERLGEVLPWWDRSIDAVLNTHPDADHLMGLVDVLERFRVDVAYETGQFKNTPVYKVWIQNVFTPHEIVRFGDVIDLGGGAELRVVGPLADVDGQLLAEPNDASIFLELTYGDFSMLFTGDASFIPENKLIAAGVLNDVDLLKVGHHGSASSTGTAFLEVTKPEVAVISVAADNTYGHPRLEVLMRLRDRGATIHRTDTEGTIRIVSDGSGHDIRTRN